ncbi:hypothetical protein [Brassicibacter mesophilus]|uniref:hypothetical protein n=1 Tax=Brassicibacter mesophilus TaxID=745119 RepID=UPI003D215072
MKIFLTILFSLFVFTFFGMSLNKEEFTDTRGHYIMATCVLCVLLFFMHFKVM